MRPPRWARLGAVCLAAALRGLDGLPSGVAERALAVVALGQSFLQPSHVRRAVAWASHHRRGFRQRWALALALLANRGRLLVVARRLDVCDATAFQRGTLELRGLDHIEAARQRGGVILLVFHLGAGGPARPLVVHGYSVTTSGEGSRFVPPRRLAVTSGAVRRSVQWHNLRERARGLYELRRRLGQGELVIMAADAADGREAFRIALPGAALVVRSGWLVLRRLTGAVTLPVLTHSEGRRRCVTIHPALPDPTADSAGDAAACQATLGRLLEAFVRRFPEQCPSLALGAGRPEVRDGDGGAAPVAPGHPSPSGPGLP